MSNKKKYRVIVLLSIVILLLFQFNVNQQYPSVRANQLSWLSSGTYAEYQPGPNFVVVETYNSSLDINNATLWKDGGYSEVNFIDPDNNEIFTYRWEIVEVMSPNVTLSIQVNASNWIDQEFTITIDTETSQMYETDMAIGYSRLWYSAQHQSLPTPVTSNFALVFANDVSSHTGFTYTIQGLQEAVWLVATEDDYYPPSVGSRTAYSTSLSFDSDTGLLLTCGDRFQLPMVSENRLICFGGALSLVATNIDLGPPVPDWGSQLGGLIPLGIMIALILVLTIVFYFTLSRRKKQRRKVKRIERKRKRNR